MSCFAKIKSPMSGNDVTSVAYYQTTTFFPPEVGRTIYEATTTTAFKVDLGFDWTKRQIGYSDKLNFHGEPTMEEMNSILNLRLSQRQIDAANEIEEFAKEGYFNVGFTNINAFELIEGEVNLNPKYEHVETEITARDGKYYISVKPLQSDKVQKPVSKGFLNRVGFSPLLINSVEEFSNANLSELMDSLIKSPEIEEFQREMLKRLRRLMKVNPSLKLTVFDDTAVDENFQRSFYDPATNTVYIGKTLSSKFGDKELVRDLIHEAVHAYTISAINNPRTTQELQFKNEMVKLYEIYKDTFKLLQNWYGLQNVEEFAAEFLSNPYFRDGLKEAEEGTTRNQNFFLRTLTSIRNFFSSIFSGVVDRNTSMFTQVENALDNYLNYLESMGDMPDHSAENHIRFNSTYQGRQARNMGQRTPLFEDFYNFVENSVSTSSWKQLAQSIKELDPRLNSLQRLQTRFGNLSIPSAKGTLNDSIGYLESMGRILTNLQTSVDAYDNDSTNYTSEELVRIYHNALSVSELFEDQLKGFNLLLASLDTYMPKEEYTQEGKAQELASKREAIRAQVPDVDNLKESIKKKIKEIDSKIGTLNKSSRENLIKSSAAQIVPIFKTFIEKQNDPSSQLNQEIKAIEEELVIVRRQKSSNLYQNSAVGAIQKRGLEAKERDLDERLNQLNKFKSFIPTTENIITLFTNASASGMSDANMFVRYLSIGNMTGRPILDIMKQFIDVHIVEAENESIKSRNRIQALEKRISDLNKRRDRKNKLGSALGSLSAFYEGFTRQVEMDYYDANGKKTTIKQTAYQTRFKEAEFQNDLKAKQQALNQALKKGDEVEIAEAEKAFNDFVEAYAVRPFTDEYYEAESLLTDEAREARQELFDLINATNDIFDEEDIFSEDILYSPKNTKKQLQRDLERLGSIYNKDGSEKPVGSKERNIAESIIAYKKARKELEITEYIIPDSVLNKFKSKKNELTRKVDEAKSKVNSAQEDVNNDVANPVSAELTQSLNNKLTDAKNKLKEATDVLNKWLNENTRTEIDPKFFEKQRMIADKIKQILAKYGEQAEVPELYQQIFSTARGYRDRDGVVIGSDMSEGLIQKINELETKLENLKSESRKSRKISAADKKTLKDLFQALNELQRKEETEYYHETVAEIKNNLKSEILADADRTNTIKAEAQEKVDYFINTGDDSVFRGIQVDDIQEFADVEFGETVNTQHRAALIQQVYDKLLQREVQNDYYQSSWYKNNHILVDKSYIDENTGEEVPLFESRPIYIWNKTIPKDNRYIKQQSPSFTWYIPKIRDAFKVKDAKFLGEFRPRATADRRYANEEYEKIEREQPELRELIDEMVGIYEEQQKALPVSQRNEGYTVINRGKTGNEKTLDTYTRFGYRVITGWDSFKVLLKRNIPGANAESEEVEVDIETANKQLGKGRLVRLVKTRYKEPLSSNQVSSDLLGSLSQFSLYVSEFKALRKAMPVVFSLRDAAAESSQGRETEVKMLDDLVYRFFYGEELKFRNAEKVIPEFAMPIYRGLIRLLSKTFRFTQARVLIFNLLRWPKNLITNILRATVNAKKYGVRRRDTLLGMAKGFWNYATMLSLHAGNRKMNKEAMFMTYFRAIPSADPSRQAGKIHQHAIFKYMNGGFFNDATGGYLEGASTRGVYESIMKQSKIPITIDGQTRYVNVRDAYDLIDGTFVPKDGVFGLEMNLMRQLILERKSNLESFLIDAGVTNREELPAKLRIQYDNLLKAQDQKIAALEERNKPKKLKLQNLEQAIRDDIHQMYTSTQGNYFKRSRSQYETSLFLGILFSMKRWLVPSLQNTYGQRRFNINTGRIDQGYLNYFFIEFLFRNLKYLATGQRLSLGSTSHQKERLHRTVIDTAVTYSMMGISHYLGAAALAAMAKLGEGDDDDSKTFWTVLMALIAAGTYDEYTTVRPEAAYNYYVKTFKKKPLEKYGTDENAAESVIRHLITSAIGQQSRSFFEFLEGIEMIGKGILNPNETYQEQYGDKYQIKDAGPMQGKRLIVAGLARTMGIELGIKPLQNAKAISQRYINQMRYTPLLGTPDVAGDIVMIDNEIDEIKKDIFKRPQKLMEDLAKIERSQMIATKKGLKVNENESEEFINKYLESEEGTVIIDKMAKIIALQRQKKQIINENIILLEKENQKLIGQYQGRKDAETQEKIAKKLLGKKGIGGIEKTEQYEVEKGRENLWQKAVMKRLNMEVEKNKSLINEDFEKAKTTLPEDIEFNEDGQYQPFR